MTTWFLDLWTDSGMCSWCQGATCSTGQVSGPCCPLPQARRMGVSDWRCCMKICCSLWALVSTTKGSSWNYPYTPCHCPCNRNLGALITKSIIQTEHDISRTGQMQTTEEMCRKNNTFCTSN